MPAGRGAADGIPLHAYAPCGGILRNNIQCSVHIVQRRRMKHIDGIFQDNGIISQFPDSGSIGIALVSIGRTGCIRATRHHQYKGLFLSYQYRCQRHSASIFIGADVIGRILIRLYNAGTGVDGIGCRLLLVGNSHLFFSKRSKGRLLEAAIIGGKQFLRPIGIRCRDVQSRWINLLTGKIPVFRVVRINGYSCQLRLFLASTQKNGNHAKQCNQDFFHDIRCLLFSFDRHTVQ